MGTVKQGINPSPVRHLSQSVPRTGGVQKFSHDDRPEDALQRLVVQSVRAQHTQCILCVHFVVSSVTCAVTVKSLVMVTPSILSWSWRSIPAIVGGDGESRSFFRRHRLSANTTSADFSRLSLRWFAFAHNCMWFNSASLEVWFTAGTMRYVSSANLQSEFPGVIAARCPVLMTYEAGPTADHWIMLAVMSSSEEVCPRKDVQCEWPEK